MASRRIMLLDTASLYFRAFYGVPDSFRAPDGTPVNAVRGLLDFISRLVTTYDPSHLVCCWDNDWRPQWRVDLLPSYKAHRVASPGQVQVAEMASSADTAGEQAPDDLAVQVPSMGDLEGLLARIRADGNVSTHTTTVLSVPYEDRPPI